MQNNNRNSFEDGLSRMRQDFEEVMGAMYDFMRGAVEGGASAVSQRVSDPPRRPPVHPRVLAEELNRMRARLDDFLDRLSEQIPEAQPAKTDPADEDVIIVDVDAEQQPDPRADALRKAVAGMEQAVEGLEKAYDALLDADSAK